MNIETNENERIVFYWPIRLIIAGLVILALSACRAEDIPESETDKPGSSTSIESDNNDDEKDTGKKSTNDQTPLENGISIEEIEWDAEEQNLKIEGKASNSAEKIIIINAESGLQLASVAIDEDDGEWKVKIQNPVPVPCRIRIEQGEQNMEREVSNAPDNCGLGGSDGNDDDVPAPVPDPNPVPDPTPTPTPDVISGNVQVFAFNDLGMHCMDEDFSVFSVLPPFNVLRAQVIQKGTSTQSPQILNPAQVDVQYSATSDPSGSINSTSIGKTGFWDHVQSLFGANPEPDTGLLGTKMPSQQNGPQTFHEFSANFNWFSADGIPITPTDDSGATNPYPLFKISSFDKSNGALISSLDVTVPVSTEMNCSDCHNNGSVAADDATANRYGSTALVWSDSNDSVIQYKENILILHDAKHGTNITNATPVLCADCHYSPALDLSGAGPQGTQLSTSFMSHAIHGRHGMTIAGDRPDAANPPVISDEGKDACYNCHPGKKTQCYRGAMFAAGISCQNCHGGLLQISGEFALADGSIRQPWQDLPIMPVLSHR